MPDPLVLQQPHGPAAQLFLLFHGVGSTPESLAPLGRRLAMAFPQAAVLSVQAPTASDLGAGWQWFSVQGITEENREQRVAEAMPEFLATVKRWQQATGVEPAATALVGFSQGAILALEATQQAETVCGRVVALSGRFATAPSVVPPSTVLHFVHGKADAVIHYGHTVQAAERLVRLGADVTADVLPFLGHEITREVHELVLERLQGYVPQRRWQEALQEAEQNGSGSESNPGTDSPPSS